MQNCCGAKNGVNDKTERVLPCLQSSCGHQVVKRMRVKWPLPGTYAASDWVRLRASSDWGLAEVCEGLYSD